MLYVTRDGAGDITAICNNPTTAENLRALIDDSIEEVPAAGAAEDYVFIINGKSGSQHIATSEAAQAETYEQVAAPAEELKQHIEDCRTAEECFGPEPAIWEGYQSKHEEVCDSLDNLSKTYQSENTSTEAKAAALNHSTAALKNANNYLVEQLTAVERRNQDMLREMQELRQELADMRASVQGYSPEKFAQSMVVAIKFLEEANGSYKHAQQPGRNYGKLYKHTRRTVHKVYRDVIDTPKRIRNAVKDKAYSVVDRGIRKIARVFDKGLQSLQEKKQTTTCLT